MNRFVLPLLIVLLLAGAGAWWRLTESAVDNNNHQDSQASAVTRSPFERTPLIPQAPDSASNTSTAPLVPRLLELNNEGLQALDDGHFERAVGLFEDALEFDSEQPVLKGNLANALVAWAVELQQQGDLHVALDLLSRAIDLDPYSAGGYYWLAHLTLRQGDRVGAKAVLDAALLQGVEHAALLRMLADLAAVEGELDQSVELIDRALALDSGNETLQERAAQLRAEREMFRTFLTDATAHFDSRYDPQDQGIVAALPELNRDLEAAWQDVVGMLGVQPQDRLLVIWLDAKRYRWQAPAWSAALFDGRVRVVIEDYEREQQAIRRTLRHELTHAVLHTIGTPLPTWLHEGLAQSAEGHDFQAVLASLPADGPKQRLEQLVGNWTTWTDRTRVTEAYAYSLGFCGWLRAEFGQSVMANLFLNLNGRTFEEAWSLTFGLDIAATDVLFRESLKRL